MKSLADLKKHDAVYIDGMNLLTRSHFGMRGLEYKGRPTGMLYGIARFVLDWSGRVSSVVFIWEGGDSWRKEKHPVYKSHRGKDSNPETRKVFFDEVDRVREVLPVMGVDQVWAPTYEADDVAWTLGSTKDGKSKLFSSGDWDWWPLSLYGDVLYQHSRVYSSDELDLLFSKKYKCTVPMDKLWMFKTLTGDASDNLSGVPRFPKKLAAQVAKNVSSLDEIYGYLRSVGSHVWAEKYHAHRWLVDRNAELVRLYDVPETVFVKGDYSKIDFGDVLIKSGMENLYERLG